MSGHLDVPLAQAAAARLVDVPTGAVQLPVERREPGVSVVRLDPVTRGLMRIASLVLAVRGPLPAEALRRQVPSQCRIAPVEDLIAPLVGPVPPGIALLPLPAPPPQLPAAAEAAYFALDQSSTRFAELDASAAIAIHVGGVLSRDLALELWAVMPAPGAMSLRGIHSLELVQRKYGVRVALLDGPTKSLLGTARFVLAARAPLDPDELRRRLPDCCKIGPVEQIAQLVNVALQGIALQPLATAPPPLPAVAGTAYFAFERSSQCFRDLGVSTGIAVFVSGDLPELALELWAIEPTAGTTAGGTA